MLYLLSSKQLAAVRIHLELMIEPLHHKAVSSFELSKKRYANQGNSFLDILWTLRSFGLAPGPFAFPQLS